MSEYERSLRVDLQVARYDYYHAENVHIKRMCKGVVVMLESLVRQADSQAAESFETFE